MSSRLPLFLPADTPPRLYTRQVLDLVGVGQATWGRMRKEGKAPEPVYRGKQGDVYLTVDIARFLGLLDDKAKAPEYDPILQGIKQIGRH